MLDDTCKSHRNMTLNFFTLLSRDIAQVCNLGTPKNRDTITLNLANNDVEKHLLKEILNPE